MILLMDGVDVKYMYVCIYIYTYAMVNLHAKCPKTQLSFFSLKLSKYTHV